MLDLHVLALYNNGGFMSTTKYSETKGNVISAKIKAVCPYCGENMTFTFPFLPEEFNGICFNKNCRLTFKVITTKANLTYEASDCK